MHLLSPLLFSSLAYAGVHRLNKRTLPPLEDFPDQEPENTRKGLLQSALPDAITLAATVSGTQLSYQDIWDKYFPRENQQTVQALWNNIISDTTNPGTGTDVLQHAAIIGFDVASGSAANGLTADWCAQGYDAYTVPVDLGAIQGAVPGQSISYFCPRAFNSPNKLSDITCDQVSDAVSIDMDTLGVTILHEWMHNDLIGAAVTGTHITDVLGMAGYGFYAVRQLLANHPTEAINNADSFTLLALEVYWTKQCKSGRDRFNDPVTPPAVSCQHAADPSGGTGVCPAVGAAGWCDCGTAGDYPTVDGDDICPYTTQPEQGPYVLPTTGCEPTGSTSSATCGPYDVSLADAQTMNQQLNDLGANGESACCALGKGCFNVVSTDGVAFDLCSTGDDWQCVDCARMANYAAGIISTCQQDGMVGGKQDIVEAPGLSIAI